MSVTAISMAGSSPVLWGNGSMMYAMESFRALIREILRKKIASAPARPGVGGSAAQTMQAAIRRGCTQPLSAGKVLSLVASVDLLL
jgi:hypothetical protein